MRAVSIKRQRQMVEFRQLRDDYLAEHRFCEFPKGCDRRAVLVHHKRGRTGPRLLDVTYFAASCWHHNEYAETNTGESLRIGWLLPISGVADEDVPA